MLEWCMAENVMFFEPYQAKNDKKKKNIRNNIG